MDCALCQKRADESTGRVEVRGFQVTKDQQKSLKAKWGDDGEATFHHDCWSRLRKAARGMGDMQLTDLEVKLQKESDKTAEYHDSDSHVKKEAAKIAHMIKTSSYCISFTGAGISTAAGIGDFRGKDGKWTNQSKQKEYGAKGLKKGGKSGFSLVQLRPTYTHEAIVKLVEMGYIKYLISQNTDGLHRLSGIPEDKISELHGNAFVEKCEKCEARYTRPLSYRNYPAAKQPVPPNPCQRCHIDHRTGRVCEKKECGGYLMNTIINFGDYLEGPVLGMAEVNAKKADLVLCLGSTLRVSPANSLVEMGKQPIRLVICNRQGTPYDDYCSADSKTGEAHGSRIYGDCDKFMREVMAAILDEESLQEWEDGREGRMEKYAKLRQ